MQPHISSSVHLSKGAARTILNVVHVQDVTEAIRSVSESAA